MGAPGTSEVSSPGVHWGRQAEVIVALLLLFWEAAWPHIHHILKAEACTGWENYFILLFIWFHMEWSKAPACLWKKSPRDLPIWRAVMCKQMLLFYKRFWKRDTFVVWKHGDKPHDTAYLAGWLWRQMADWQLETSCGEGEKGRSEFLYEYPSLHPHDHWEVFQVRMSYLVT